MKRRVQRRVYLVIATGFFLVGSQLAQADEPTAPEYQVTLAWDENPEPDIDGYRLYYGTQSGTYPEMVDVGITTTSQLILPEAGDYYAVVTAYNTAGLESLPSNEVVFSVSAQDLTDPVIVGIPGDVVTVPDSPQGTSAIVSWTEPTATDNIGIDSLSSTHESGDSFPEGSTTVVYTATDAAGNVSTAEFSVTVTSVELWRQSVFGSDSNDTEIAGDAANPDGDVWNNLAEYALGLDPLVSDGEALTDLELEAGELQFRMSHARLLPDVTLIVESFTPPSSEYDQLATLSPTGGWTVIAPNLEIASVDSGEMVEVTLTRSVLGIPSEFFRLVVERLEEP